MNYYEVKLPSGVQICTRNAVTELPSLFELIRDARDSKLLRENEFPSVVYRNRALSKKRIALILRQTEIQR